MKRLCLFFCAIVVAFAADPRSNLCTLPETCSSTTTPPTAPEAAKPPIIKPDHLAEYYRSDGVLARVQQMLKEAQDDLNKAVADVRNDCGPKFVPTADGKNLVCAPLPVK